MRLTHAPPNQRQLRLALLVYTLQVHRRLFDWLPEIALTIAALFFTYRELGTFPGAWLDEGLFIMTAKNLAAGKGYGIPLLNEVWYYPYFLAVGPTVILPVAAAIKLFGLSIAAARIPMTLYILGTCIGMYAFTWKIADRTAARWSTALLVTLSAFINTGKPVLGEVPGFFFIMLGLLAMVWIEKPIHRGIASGVFFGLAIVSKLTFGIMLPSLAFVMFAAMIGRRWKTTLSVGISGCVAAVLYIPWRIIESLHTPAGSLSEELGKFVFGGGDTPLLYVLRENREILTRLPSLAFAFIFVVAVTGVWSPRCTVSRSVKLLVCTTAGLFTLYFLNSYGWYRHLLPAHLILLPFVPFGVEFIGGRKPAMAILSVIIAAQGVWQLQHRGSGFGTASAEGARIVQEQYAETNLLIEEAELMAQLPENPHWLYLIRERVSPSMPERFRTPAAGQLCWQHVRKLNEEEERQFSGAAIKAGGYYILPPAPGCE